MNKDQKNTIRAMTGAELTKRLSEIGSHLLDHKMQVMVGKLKNVRQLKALRHERAIIKTIQAEKIL